MKTSFVTLLLSALLFDFNNTNDQQGTYTIDGKTYNGKVSTQEFVNKNFSVLCEYSDESSPDYKKWKYDLLQVTFHNKAEALKGGVFKISSTSSINQESGYVSIGGHDGFTNLFGDGSSTITVTNKTIKISNIKLFQYPATHLSTNKNYLINSVAIPFE
ncbi:hypothetical protein GCM10011514_02720 [Emticicia aquatilis]|uniref:Uncharacterized protein n=1 Tax=Emticicia aquatilis TaxID=1537369 RepID=A0A917DJX4_9BACT|nr:hypothetical protein [Emticicia aquatilis]GGD42205.1 hypothetical protein GCM10011514_02720 [Emticicia aquatilis]